MLLKDTHLFPQHELEICRRGAIIDSQNTCDNSTLETYYLNFIAIDSYMRKSGCSVLRMSSGVPRPGAVCLRSQNSESCHTSIVLSRFPVRVFSIKKYGVLIA